MLTIYGEKLYTSIKKIHRIAAETENHIKTLVAGNAGEINIEPSRYRLYFNLGNTTRTSRQRLSSIPLTEIELERTFYIVRDMTLTPVYVEYFWRFLNFYGR